MVLITNLKQTGLGPFDRHVEGEPKLLSARGRARGEEDERVLGGQTADHRRRGLRGPRRDNSALREPDGEQRQGDHAAQELQGVRRPDEAKRQPHAPHGHRELPARRAHGQHGADTLRVLVLLRPARPLPPLLHGARQCAQRVHHRHARGLQVPPEALQVLQRARRLVQAPLQRSASAKPDLGRLAVAVADAAVDNRIVIGHRSPVAK